MAVNKNFVVKNGLEVNADLIYADHDNRKVGIASTGPRVELDVRGGIAATDASISGILTAGTRFEVGTSGTSLTVLETGRVGIGTTNPIFLVDIRNVDPTVSTGVTALYVQGDARFTGVVTASTLSGAGVAVTSGVFDTINVGTAATIENFHFYSGIVTAVTGIVTYYGDGSRLTGVAGAVTPLGPGGSIQYNDDGAFNGNIEFFFVEGTDSVGIGTTIPVDKLQVRGGTTLDNVTVTGIATLNQVTASGVSVSGVTTLSSDVTVTGYLDANNYVDVAQGINAAGISTFESGLKVSGIVTSNDTSSPGLALTFYGDDLGIYKRFIVTNNASGAYEFSATGIGFTTNADNPTIVLNRGNKYIFDINASGHPFYIKTQQGTGTDNQYTKGVTNNGAEVGQVIFEVPFGEGEPSTLYYQCSNHSAMVGQISIGGGGGGGGSIGIQSTFGIPASSERIGYGITDFNFVGAGVSLVGVSTAVVTINKTLVIGTRSGAQTINVSSGIATIQLRSGVGTVRF